VDHELLRAAEEQIVAVVKASNEAAARGANHARMRQIARYFPAHQARDIVVPSRNFIHEGTLHCFSGDGNPLAVAHPGEGKPVVLFLFNDLLLVADRLKSPKLLDPAKRHKGCFPSLHRIPLASARIVNLVVSSSSATAETTECTSFEEEEREEEGKQLQQQQQQQQPQEGKKVKGSLRRGRRKESPDSAPSQHHLHRFEVRALWRGAEEDHVVRRYSFGAESEQEKRMWFRSIQKLINDALLRQLQVPPALPAFPEGITVPDDKVEEDRAKRAATIASPSSSSSTTISTPIKGSPISSGLFAKASFRRKPGGLRSSDQSPAAVQEEKANDMRVKEEDQEGKRLKDEAEEQGESGWVKKRFEGSGIARDEVALLRDEIHQLKLQLHSVRAHFTPLFQDEMPSLTQEPSASPPNPTTFDSPKRRQRRSQSATS
jgi:hypothetical protein